MNSTLTFICMLYGPSLCVHMHPHTHIYIHIYIHSVTLANLLFHVHNYFHFIYFYLILHFLLMIAMQKSDYNEKISLAWRFPKYLIPYGGFILWLLHSRHLNKKSACVKTEKKIQHLVSEALLPRNYPKRIYQLIKLTF